MSSKKYQWRTFEALREYPGDETDEQHNALTLPHPDENKFTIRHLKQGATGAVKTWPAAEVLVDYLVRRGGMRDVCEKVMNHGSASSSNSTSSITCSFMTSDDTTDISSIPATLNLIQPPPPEASFSCSQDSNIDKNMDTIQKPYNIMELGGGTGYMSVALALALNHIESTSSDISQSQSQCPARVRVMCTDNDRATIKNMRHNISRQPHSMNMNKTVRIESLDWGSELHMEQADGKFMNAVRSHFQQPKKKGSECESESESKSESESECAQQSHIDDPIRLLSHLIASDVHYGKTTLEPLSSIISTIKARNPSIVVIMLLKERSANAVAELKHEIEHKVKLKLESKGLEEQEQEVVEQGQGHGHAQGQGSVASASTDLHADLNDKDKELLRNFSVSVRNVLHDDLPNMKMVEC